MLENTMSAQSRLRTSPLLRLLVLGVLALLLLIPVAWIRDLISERATRRQEAVQEVVSKWGHTQTLAGPALVVPYRQRRIERVSDEKEIEKVQARYLTVLPDVLHVDARVDGEERYRGIFVVPVYQVQLDVSGELSPPDLKALDIDPATLEWHRARVVVGLSDARVIQNRATMTWNGETRPFRPGAGDLPVVPSGIHAPLQGQPDGRVKFSFRLQAQGSSGLFFAPLGQETVVTVDSNWASPSFQGNWLPSTRSVSETGFRATWRIPFLGRGQPTAWTTAVQEKAACLESTPFGVDLRMPVDAHRMADRSVKYAHLFILLTFGTIWLVEVLARVRVHPIQYLMIAAALCLFYLLELAFGGQIGFEKAYALASTAIVALVGSYTAVVLSGWRRAAGVAALVAGLNAYLYVLLMNEDYALLLGSIGLFLALAATMLLTRRIDWYAIGRETRSAPSPHGLEA
jgi:inner membrane protein